MISKSGAMAPRAHGGGQSNVRDCRASVCIVAQPAIIGAIIPMRMRACATRAGAHASDAGRLGT